MLDLRFDPFVDDVLRRHLYQAAARLSVSVDDLEEILDDESDALEFLKEVGDDAWRAYVEDTSRRVDYVGWLVVPGSRRVRSPQG